MFNNVKDTELISTSELYVEEIEHIDNEEENAMGIRKKRY